MNFIKEVPLFGVSLLLFWVSSWFGINRYLFTNAPISVSFTSGVYTPTWSYLVMMVGMLFLFIEVMKASMPNSSKNEHMLSVITLIAYIFCIISMSWALNSVVIFFAVGSLLDVLLSYGIGVAVSKKDISFR